MVLGLGIVAQSDEVDRVRMERFSFYFSSELLLLFSLARLPSFRRGRGMTRKGRRRTEGEGGRGRGEGGGAGSVGEPRKKKRT